MDQRQRKIETLFTEYFRHRPDAAMEPVANGAYCLKLRSDHARGQFGGREEFILVFDAEKSYEHPDWELINSRHPFLEVVRNDLGSLNREDPRLAEAYLSPQPVSPGGEILLPHLQVNGAISRIEYEYLYQPLWVLSYKVVFEADERQDYILRLCFDAWTGENRDDVMPHLSRLPLCAGRPDSATDLGQFLSLETIIKRGRAVIETRVRPELSAFAAGYARQLEADRQRLEQFYEQEAGKLHPRDEEGRQRLRATLQKEIKDLEEKYACRARASLVSALLLWEPVISYQVAASSHTAAFTIGGIHYRGVSDNTEVQPCPRCGNVQNLAICSAGQHAFCGLLECVEQAQCRACGDLYCPEDGGNCTHCSDAACRAHQAVCEYGSHQPTAKFCSRCIETSFEERSICADCATNCQLCARIFPGEMIAECRPGGESFCLAHDRQPDGEICVECRRPSCRQHGRVTAERVWTCADHSQAASCCQQFFGNSRLAVCTADQKEILCPTHRLMCAVGQETVCRQHVISSWRNEPLCAKHAGRCVSCSRLQSPRIHRTDRLGRCVICAGAVCGEHAVRCDVCQSTYFCAEHRLAQPACASCGRVSCNAQGCRAEDAKCQLCLMQYCRHCLGRDSVCTTCTNQGSMDRASRVYPLLEALQSAPDERLRQVAQAMLKSFNECVMTSAENLTYRVVVMEHRPARWKLWQKAARLRIVTRLDDSIVRVKPEMIV